MKKLEYNGKRNICGAGVRRLRTTRRMTQGELAAKVQLEGVSMEQDGISRVESGDRLVTDYELRAFASALRVPMEVLLDGEEGRGEEKPE